ncbi:MAG: hypothetical protein CMH30_03980 [Micavibrio sp.]|nr:hypothetical protein [Micavibrio sp.]
MTKNNRFSYLFILLALFVAAYIFRPVLPIDETRYLTVAWEMFFRKTIAMLSLNFEPYHHKPPLLFWAINAVWHVFGVSRWAAMIPIFIGAAAVLVLTEKLTALLYPARKDFAKIMPWMVLGAVSFIVYSTLMMFDTIVAAFVLGALYLFLRYCQTPTKIWPIILCGLCVGLGVLTKGPVLLLYVFIPILLQPFWKIETLVLTKTQYFKALGVILAVGLVVVSLWLIPLIQEADGHFLYWLLWEQTVGRIEGNFSSSHARPIYFYLMFLPAFSLPWLFFPSFWKGVLKTSVLTPPSRFLLSCVVPAFICFSFISGKQPHYLVPLMPFLLIFIGQFIYTGNAKKILMTSLTMILVVIVGQGVASQTIFKNYDLNPIIDFYQSHKDADYAYINKYQGEFGFLGRIEKHIDVIEYNKVSVWLDEHPNGYIIMRYAALEMLDGYRVHLSIPYRSKDLAIITK